MSASGGSVDSKGSREAKEEPVDDDAVPGTETKFPDATELTTHCVRNPYAKKIYSCTGDIVCPRCPCRIRGVLQLQRVDNLIKGKAEKGDVPFPVTSSIYPITKQDRYGVNLKATCPACQNAVIITLRLMPVPTGLAIPLSVTTQQKDLIRLLHCPDCGGYLRGILGFGFPEWEAKDSFEAIMPQRKKSRGGGAYDIDGNPYDVTHADPWGENYLVSCPVCEKKIVFGWRAIPVKKTTGEFEFREATRREGSRVFDRGCNRVISVFNLPEDEEEANDPDNNRKLPADGKEVKADEDEEDDDHDNSKLSTKEEDEDAADNTKLGAVPSASTVSTQVTSHVREQNEQSENGSHACAKTDGTGTHLKEKTSKATIDASDKRLWYRTCAREPYPVIPGLLRVSESGEQYVDFYQELGTVPITDYGNVVAGYYSIFLEQLVEHFHVPRLWITKAHCDICAKLTGTVCTECNPPTPLCVDPRCTRAHVNEVTEREEKNPKHYRQESFVRKLFDQMATSNTV